MNDESTPTFKRNRLLHLNRFVSQLPEPRGSLSWKILGTASKPLEFVSYELRQSGICGKLAGQQIKLNLSHPLPPALSTC